MTDGASYVRIAFWQQRHCPWSEATPAWWLPEPCRTKSWQDITRHHIITSSHIITHHHTLARHCNLFGLLRLHRIMGLHLKSKQDMVKYHQSKKEHPLRPKHTNNFFVVQLDGPNAIDLVHRLVDTHSIRIFRNFRSCSWFFHDRLLR